MLDTPVLFMVFNRPDTTTQVFETIRRVAPKQLFIAADGPRRGRKDDVERCRQVREIVSKIEWDCDIKTLFREENLGCKYAVSSAIDWFFGHVEEGIILEDDTLPDLSFFLFCEKLLKHYRDDKKVMHISGFNFQSSIQTVISSYYFSKYPHVWGWATWKRAWNLYNIELTGWKELSENSKYKNKFNNLKEYTYWKSWFNDVYTSKLNTWDIQWLFTLWSNDGLSITPNKNLVSNIGMGLSDATHTTGHHVYLSNVQLLSADAELRHPDNRHLNVIADNLLFENIFYPWRKSISLKKIIHDNFYRYLPDIIKDEYRKLKKYEFLKLY